MIITPSGDSAANQGEQLGYTILFPSHHMEHMLCVPGATLFLHVRCTDNAELEAIPACNGNGIGKQLLLLSAAVVTRDTRVLSTPWTRSRRRRRFGLRSGRCSRGCGEVEKKDRSLRDEEGLCLVGLHGKKSLDLETTDAALNAGGGQSCMGAATIGRLPAWPHGLVRGTGTKGVAVPLAGACLAVRCCAQVQDWSPRPTLHTQQPFCRIQVKRNNNRDSKNNRARKRSKVQAK